MKEYPILMGMIMFTALFVIAGNLIADLLIAAGNTGLTVNIKKGQFLSPEAMGFAVEKVRSTGNDKIWLCERGTT